MSRSVVILAAGYGTRMRSNIPKVLHPLAGKTLVEWSVDVATEMSGASPIVVVGHEGERVKDVLQERAEYAFQAEQLGTGHALQQAEPLLSDRGGSVLVLYADMPLLQSETLERLLTDFERARSQSSETAMAMLTIVREDPQGFGRIIRNDRNEVVAIVEEVDCTPEQLQIQELNPGIYCFDGEWLWENIGKLEVSSKGEYFLTDMVAMAAATGRTILSLQAPTEEVYGINDRSHLAVASKVIRQRINHQHMILGVTILNPENTYIDAGVIIGQDTTILPGTVLEGATQIGKDCTVGPHSTVIDSQIDDSCTVTYSVIESARMDKGAQVGPFGHLRKGAHLGPNVHMGNFGEVKNSYLAHDVKMGHFSYIGDAMIGANVNIGAGTITCNYDGSRKNRTTVGEDAFIGSATLLVAPVEVGAAARTGAGSVVTRDVPANTLVYGVPARPPHSDDSSLPGKPDRS